MPRERVLIVDDDAAIRFTLTEALREWGYEPLEAPNLATALEVFDAEQPSAVLQDINLPDGSGLEVLPEYKKRQPQVIVIMITGNVQLDDTISALRGGAHDFISKPIRLSELQVTIRNGIETGRLRREVHQLRRQQEQRFGFDQIIGQSAAMAEMVALARKVAISEASSVLLQGESGTGKDLIAKAIHYGSARAEQPFVAINCAAIPATLIESELFGHERGAFTGAVSRRDGCFELANGGTLFLDEIAEMPVMLQAKLLRVLEDRKVRRLGGSKEIPVDVRVLAATNKDPLEAVRKGEFREDLLYRLNVIHVKLPPLRERRDDIPLLAQHMVKELSERHQRPARLISHEVLEIFARHPWPGNVRELRNVMEHAIIICDGQRIEKQHLSSQLFDGRSLRAEETITLPVGIALDEAERQLILKTLIKTNNNKTRAAELLQISLKTLHNKLKLYREEGEE